MTLRAVREFEKEGSRQLVIRKARDGEWYNEVVDSGKELLVLHREQTLLLQKQHRLRYKPHRSDRQFQQKLLHCQLGQEKDYPPDAPWYHSSPPSSPPTRALSTLSPLISPELCLPVEDNCTFRLRALQARGEHVELLFSAVATPCKHRFLVGIGNILHKGILDSLVISNIVTLIVV